MEFLIQISMFSPLVSETFPCTVSSENVSAPEAFHCMRKKMVSIRGTLFLVKIKQGKTQHEHNEKFKRIAA